MAEWFIYMVQCADNSLYTGITTNLQRRLREHNEGRTAARYTRARRPVELVYAEAATDRSTAAQREYQIKQLDSRQKQKLLTARKQTPATPITPCILDSKPS